MVINRRWRWRPRFCERWLAPPNSCRSDAWHRQPAEDGERRGVPVGCLHQRSAPKGPPARFTAEEGGTSNSPCARLRPQPLSNRHRDRRWCAGGTVTVPELCQRGLPQARWVHTRSWARTTCADPGPQCLWGKSATTLRCFQCGTGSGSDRPASLGALWS